MLIFEGILRSGEVTEPLHRGLNPFLDQGPGWAEQLNLDDCLGAPGCLLPDALNGAVDQDDRGDPPLGTEDQALVGRSEQLLAITRHAYRIRIEEREQVDRLRYQKDHPDIISRRSKDMASVSQVECSLKHIMEERANVLARETGCIERQRKFSGADLL